MSERYTLFSQGFHAYRIVQLCSWWCKAQVSNSKKIAKYSFTSLICQIYNVCQGTIREKPSLIAYDIFVLRIQCSEWIYRARICKPFKESRNRFPAWRGLYDNLTYPSARARICRPFKEPRRRFPAWRTWSTTLFVAPTRQSTKAGGIGPSESIPGLHKRLQIRALAT